MRFATYRFMFSWQDGGHVECDWSRSTDYNASDNIVSGVFWHLAVGFWTI